MKQKKLKAYQLLITEEQAAVMSDALEFWNRMGMGQFTELSSLISTHHENKPTPEERDQAERALDVAKGLLIKLHSNQYYSVTSHEISDRFRVAYDLHQVIRHRLAWDRDPKKDIMNCHKDEPMRWSHKCDLAGIERVE